MKLYTFIRIRQQVGRAQAIGEVLYIHQDTAAAEEAGVRRL
jgi:hypothetical protein